MFKQFVAAAALAASALSVQAGSVQSDLGVLDAGTEFSFAEEGLASNFFHLYHFELDTAGTVTGSFSDVSGVALYSVKLASDGSYQWIQLGSDLSFSYDNLDAGYYALYVFGNTVDGVNSYSGNLIAQPVPEPETYAMLLAGLGVMGAVAARRRKSS